MDDLFASDAFSLTTLTDAIQDKVIRPGRLAEMGLFSTTSVHTLDIAVEQRGDTLQIVAPSSRGAPGEMRDYPKRSLHTFKIPHFQRDWSVIADEVQGVRAMGSSTRLETVQNKVAERISVNIADLEVTEEHARLGAIQGVITYRDGSTFDIFDRFGVSEPATIDFDLDAASPVDGVLRKRCTAMIRSVRAALGGVNFEYVHALVGDNFFDDLLMHREVRETYKGWSDERILRESYVGKNRASNPIFRFGDIVFENYGAIEDSGDGALMGIGTDLARFFPVGVPGLFRTYYAPADYNETVNTAGKRLYAKSFPMPNGKGINGEVQMNALQLCTRPGALFSGKRT